MLWNSLLKKPVLIIGILMMAVFLYNLKSGNTGNQGFSREAFKSYSCKPVVLKLEKVVPSSWSFTCTEGNLKIGIEINEKITKEQERQLLYREMANHLIFIAKTAPEENLERTGIIHLYLVGTHYRIDGIINGEEIIKFKNIKEPNLVREHLKYSVQVKETAL